MASRTSSTVRIVAEDVAKRFLDLAQMLPSNESVIPFSVAMCQGDTEVSAEVHCPRSQARMQQGYGTQLIGD